jgi:hypothetical protein
MVPLCVPIADKDIAKRAGARYDPNARSWECTADKLSHPDLQPFIPRMYKPGLVGPVIRPWLVPSPLWGVNLRALLEKTQWDRIRRDAYARAGRRCKVCGGKGEKWPVEADEAWDYDDDRCVQTLKGVIALCPLCHQVRHWGSTQLKGQTEATFSHLRRVNGWTEREADKAIEEAFDLWEKRSLKPWRSDFSWLRRNYDFEITEAGLARADEVNKSFPDPFADALFHSPTPMPTPSPPPAPVAYIPLSKIEPPPLSAPKVSKSWSLWTKASQSLKPPW